MSAATPFFNWRKQWQLLPPRWRTIGLSVLGTLLLALLLALIFHQALGRWLWPDPRYDALRQRAELALRAGKLSAADGSGARELFEAALALQPDQLEAREGLERVAQAAMARADAQIRAGHAPQAQAALQLAQILQAPQARVDALQAQLAAIPTQTDSIAVLLQRAQAALMQGHFDDGPDAALPLYRQVLQREPRNQHALDGREDVLDALTQPAARVLASGDLIKIAALLQRVEAADPGHPVLPALHAGFTQAQARRNQQLQRLLRRQQWEAAVQLCQPLAAAPTLPLPELCESGLGDALLHAANAAVAAARFDQAQHLLALAKQAGVADDRRQQVQRSLHAASRTQTQRPHLLTPQARAKVATLLAQAQRAQARGHWLTPPGESAWDRLREARALAPHDARVQQSVQDMQLAAHACYSAAMRDNNLGRARECLDAWRQLAPNEPAVLPAQRRLAERWLAVGDERLRAGDVRGARTALERAQQVDAGVPGSAALAQRLQRIPSALK